MTKKQTTDKEKPHKGGQKGNKNAQKWTQKKVDKLGEDLLAWLKQEKNIFFKEFLLQRDLYKDVVAYLESNYPSFSALIKRAREWQELKLIKLGVTGKLNHIMTIFILKNHHDYIDERRLRQLQERNYDDLSDKEVDDKITTLLAEIQQENTNGEVKAS